MMQNNEGIKGFS